MAQERFHNHNRPLLSLQENYRTVGMFFRGRYAGFDGFEVVAGNLVKMKHNVTGIYRLNLAGNANEGPFGLFSTRQGTVVYDDTEVQIAVDFVVTNPRIDALVVTHTHLDSPGGQPATYSLIKGGEAVNPQPPALSAPLTQVLLGYFVVYPGADHTLTKFIPSDLPLPGGKYSFNKANEEELNTYPEKDFNKVQRSGVYFMDATTLNAPTVATNQWSLIVLKKGTLLNQLAFNATNGRAYYRAALTFTGVKANTWSPWGSLNNVESPAADLTPILAMIGNLTYTEENYVTNDESLTLSIDALDMALQDLSDAFDALDTIVDGILSAIGNRVYSEENLITDGESITSSLDKLDKAWGRIDTAEDLNTYIKPGVYGLSSNAVNGAPGFGGTTQGGYLVVQKTLVTGINQLRQWAHNSNGGVFYRDTTDMTGATWNVWHNTTLSDLQIAGPGWNMDTTADHAIAHTLPIGAYIEEVTVRIADHPTTPTVYKMFSESVAWDDTDITLTRVAAGPFDSAAWNNAYPYVNIKFRTTIL